MPGQVWPEVMHSLHFAVRKNVPGVRVELGQGLLKIWLRDFVFVQVVEHGVKQPNWRGNRSGIRLERPGGDARRLTSRHDDERATDSWCSSLTRIRRRRPARR